MQFVGLMDHWVPSHDAVSRFWRTPFQELMPLVRDICDEIGINNFTFYTKWYTNGIKSSLPFLVNHPCAQNVLTDNDWGRQWIDFFHNRGMTVGAMLQCYTFEGGTLPREAILGSWKGTRAATGMSGDVEVVDPTWRGYPDLLAQMLEEELRLFPRLDLVFLEFEGLTGPATNHALSRLAYPEKDIPPITSPRVRSQLDSLGGTASMRDLWIWSDPAQNALRDLLRGHLSVAERAFLRMGFNGHRGLVYHAFGYEAPYVRECLPNRSWWLLPWHYWGWDLGKTVSHAIVRRQMDFCKRNFRDAVQAGYTLVYIGNATLPTKRPETIREMARWCEENNCHGHLGMGSFVPTFGLRWYNASEASVLVLRRLYREKLFPRGGSPTAG
jgi:hypothetical protein